jgi:hypothetical protein
VNICSELNGVPRAIKLRHFVDERFAVVVINRSLSQQYSVWSSVHFAQDACERHHENLVAFIIGCMQCPAPPSNRTITADKPTNDLLGALMRFSEIFDIDPLLIKQNLLRAGAVKINVCHFALLHRPHGEDTDCGGASDCKAPASFRMLSSRATGSPGAYGLATLHHLL